MLYILAIILIFFSLPIIGRLVMRLFGWWIRRKITSQARKAYGDMFGNAFGGAFGSDSSAGRDNSSASSSGRRASASQSGHQHGRRRGKRIDPSVGEYVDYEEIYVEDSSAYSSAESSESFVAESQIVDVEWEDIR